MSQGAKETVAGDVEIETDGGGDSDQLLVNRL